LNEITLKMKAVSSTAFKLTAALAIVNKKMKPISFIAESGCIFGVFL